MRERERERRRERRREREKERERSLQHPPGNFSDSFHTLVSNTTLQIHTQTDKLTDKQKGIHTYRQTHRRTNRYVFKKIQ